MGGPDLQSPRSDLSCAVHPTDDSILFAIGGFYGGTYLSSIEKVDIAASITEYVGSLTFELIQTRAVAYNEMIYILGGIFRDVVDAELIEDIHDCVHILDPNTGLVSLWDEELAYGVYGSAAITVNNNIYMFGGMSQVSDREMRELGLESRVDKWMKYTFNNSFSTSKTTSSTASTLKVTEQEPQVPVDLIFILDSSGSVAVDDDDFSNWQAEIDFVATALRNIPPASETRIGLINFSGCGPSVTFA